jgi:hypothetical protein
MGMAPLLWPWRGQRQAAVKREKSKNQTTARFFGAGGQKDLQRGVGEDDGAHVAPIGQQAGQLLKAVL